MNKLLLIPAILFAGNLIAKEYKYEITPVIGYNIAEGNLNLENQFLVGLEAQINTDTFLKPELSILFSDANYEDLPINPSTDIWRFAFNGVHDFDAIGAFTPLMKVGIGYETIENNLARNDDSLFIDAGVGVKAAIADNWSLKFEAVYMNKEFDSNLALLAGVSYSFGEKAQREAPVTQKAPKQVVVKEIPKPIVTEALIVLAPKFDGDSDQDGIFNSKDKCPFTPLGNVVDADGCTEKVNLHINFENDSFNVDIASQQRVAGYANFLKERINYTTQIIGHTSLKGEAPYNQRLSQRRAQAVKELLIAYGIDASRISTLGKGETEPIVQGDSEAAHAQNRRIEATLTKH